MQHSLRTFMAIVFDQSTAEQLLATLESQLPMQHPLRVTPVENLHLTLLFLGNTSEEKLQQLAQTLLPYLQGVLPIPLVLESLGSFPEVPSRILAARVQECEPLMRLQKAVASAAEQCDLDYDKKPFLPHITLARSRETLNPGKPLSGIKLTGSKLALITSQQDHTGSYYQHVAEFALPVQPE